MGPGPIAKEDTMTLWSDRRVVGLTSLWGIISSLFVITRSRILSPLVGDNISWVR